MAKKQSETDQRTPQTDVDPAAEAPTVQTPGDRSTPAGDAPAAQPRGRQSVQPDCPYCKKACKAGRSTPFFTYYYCQEPGCSFSVKQPRPNMPSRLHQAEQQQDHSAR